MDPGILSRFYLTPIRVFPQHLAAAELKLGVQMHFEGDGWGVFPQHLAAAELKLARRL